MLKKYLCLMLLVLPSSLFCVAPWPPLENAARDVVKHFWADVQGGTEALVRRDCLNDLQDHFNANFSDPSKMPTSYKSLDDFIKQLCQMTKGQQVELGPIQVEVSFKPVLDVWIFQKWQVTLLYNVTIGAKTYRFISHCHVQGTAYSWGGWMRSNQTYDPIFQ